MNLAEAKDRLYDMAAAFFQGATVIWAEQANTKPTPPYATLKCGNVVRTAFPVDDGEGWRGYQTQTTLEVNLYTKGQTVAGGGNASASRANTAASDLTEFANFLDSDAMVDMIAGCGMDVQLMPPVRDLSDLQNGTQYRYRAMAEFSVTFAQEAGGSYGTVGMPLVPNSSGGGTEEMAGEESAAIEAIEIEEGGQEN